jgi:hypothetical protein
MSTSPASTAPTMTDSSSWAVEEFTRVVMRDGRNRAPFHLLEWWEDGYLDGDDLREVIRTAWDMPEFPARYLPVSQWLAMFREAGFTSSTAPRPTEPMTLYRGCDRGHQRGMSWTSDFDTAAWFAMRGFNAWPTVYRAVVQPHAILAICDEPDGRNEHEVIVNPHTLRGRATPQMVDQRLVRPAAERHARQKAEHQASVLKAIGY